MSQQSPQERKLQPLPAWMLKEDEKTGGNAGAGGEQTPSPMHTQKPEHTTQAFPESKAVVSSHRPPVFGREEEQPSALRKDDLWEAIGGAILDGVVGHALGGGVVATVMGEVLAQWCVG